MSQDRRDSIGLTEDTQIVVDLTELESETAAWLPPAGHPARGAYARVAKKELDIGLGFVLLILSLPVQLGIFLLSTVLFRRWPIVSLPRVTKDGETFTMYRFATSRPDGSDGRWSGLSRQMRRWGLDELPQL
ncbi:MAG TPA: sugar transferase, partial [Acidimicrobiia bacterium]